MRVFHKVAVGLGAILTLGMLVAAPVQAAAYPDKALTMIVPYGPGGMSDLTARALGNVLQPIVGQSIGVVNRAGGGGVVGGHATATATGGYTVGLLAPVGAMPEIFRPDAASFTSGDLKPVARVAINVTTLVVSNELPVNNLKEFIEYVRKNPGLKYAHTGRGNATHLVGADLAMLEKLEMQDVPYQGDAAATTAVLGNQVQAAIITLPGVLAQIKAGKVRGIAIYLDERVSELPDVPTFAEQGVKLRMPVAFNALFAPASMPDAHVQALSEAVGKAFESEEFRDTLVKIGTHPGYLDAKAFEDELKVYKNVANQFAEQFGLGKSK